MPETLSSLRAAGIVVWLLTGDKQETAIDVSYSASLFTQNMRILKLNARTKEQAESTLRALLDKVIHAAENTNDDESVVTVGTASTTTTATVSAQAIPDDRSAKINLDEEEEETGEFGLVVDGKTLVFILDRRTQLLPMFLDLTLHCSSVLISRATPLQKALVVKLTKQSLGVITLAVGDGANDVSMIQTADIGVGISGVEGRQAVMASDFAICKFSHLHRLLLVHGHLCYSRLAKIILYFFYKNANLVLVLLWYQFFCGFSGNNFIDPNYLIQFGLTFTSMPPIILGVYDKDVPESVLHQNPSLYSVGRERQLYKDSYFWVNILDAVYQSLVIFFFALTASVSNDVGFDELGITVLHCCMVTQLVHISVETRSWTVLHVIVLFLSLFVFHLFGVLYTMTCISCFAATSLYGVWAHLLASPRHWLIVLLTTVTAVLPRFTYRSLQTSLFMTPVQKAVLQHKLLKKKRKKPNSAYAVESLAPNGSQGAAPNQVPMKTLCRSPNSGCNLDSADKKAGEGHQTSLLSTATVDTLLSEETSRL